MNRVPVRAVGDRQDTGRVTGLLDGPGLHRKGAMHSAPGFDVELGSMSFSGSTGAQILNDP